MRPRASPGVLELVYAWRSRRRPIRHASWICRREDALRGARRLRMKSLFGRCPLARLTLRSREPVDQEELWTTFRRRLTLAMEDQ